MNNLATDIQTAFQTTNMYLNYFSKFTRKLIEDVVTPRIGHFDEIQYRQNLIDLRDNSRRNGDSVKKFLKYVTDMTDRFIEQHEKKHGRKRPEVSNQSDLFNTN